MTALLGRHETRRPLAVQRRLAAHRPSAPQRLIALLAFVFAVTAAQLVAAPAVFGWDVNTFSAASEGQLISLQNQARASAGLRSLRLDTALRTIARWRSKDMVDRNYFSHTILGTSHNVFWYMQYKYGYCFKLGGENIGTVTWPGASDADATSYIFGMFMNSAGHRANILGKTWDVVAVGAYKGSGDKFMWTALFADSCSRSPAPTPKPTAEPTHRPAATPKPTVRPTAKPTTAATASASPSPSPTPSPSASPTAAPDDGALATPEPTSSDRVAPSEAPSATAPPFVPPGGLQIKDAPPEGGLIESILQVITSRFFGG